jgi:hypothetical protein
LCLLGSVTVSYGSRDVAASPTNVAAVNQTVMRRHVDAAEIDRLPTIVSAENWVVGTWTVHPFGPHDQGHHDDFVCSLTGTGPYDGLKTQVTITSYDLDNRTDDGLAWWVQRKAVEEIATAIRRNGA